MKRSENACHNDIRQCNNAVLEGGGHVLRGVDVEYFTYSDVSRLLYNHKIANEQEQYHNANKGQLNVGNTKKTYTNLTQEEKMKSSNKNYKVFLYGTISGTSKERASPIPHATPVVNSCSQIQCTRKNNPIANSQV